MPDDLPIQACEIIDGVNLAADKDLDRPAIFLTYLTFLGDSAKTAAALDIPEPLVLRLAAEESWKAKASALTKLRKDHGADALLREMNRVTNYVQGVRLRHLVDRVLRTVTSDEGFEGFITHHTKDAANVTLKPLTEITKSAEIAHRLTYNALGDSLGERLNRDDEEGVVSASVLKSLAAMSGVPTMPKNLPNKP